MEKNIILAIVCVAFFATQGLAQLLLPPDIPVPGPAQAPSLPKPGFPWLPLHKTRQEKMLIPDKSILQRMEISRCLSSILKVEGCLVEIEESLFSGKVDIIGPACCKAALEINSKCWPKLFPLTPYFPILLKSFCAKHL
ncbi:hypothetical protein ACFE04_010159 [Oxalis oulophora]